MKTSTNLSGRERTCCDGLCTGHAGSCPAFAPGIISGPHRRRGGAVWSLVRGLGRAITRLFTGGCA